jgi:hypothetical protein
MLVYALGEDLSTSLNIVECRFLQGLAEVTDCQPLIGSCPDHIKQLILVLKALNPEGCLELMVDHDLSEGVRILNLASFCEGDN